MNNSISTSHKRWEPVRLVAAMHQVVERVNWSHNNQISLSCRAGAQNHSVWVGAHGSAIEPSRVDGKIVRRDSDYTGFLAGFEHTYFYEIWDHMVREYGTACRMRLMKLEPKGCLSFHEDFFQRVHVPIITNDRSFFFINESNLVPWITSEIKVPSIETYHLPASGGMYLVDTKRHHTVYNGGNTARVHLVCSI